MNTWFVALCIAIFWLSVLALFISPLPKHIGLGHHGMMLALLGFVGTIVTFIALLLVVIVSEDPRVSQIPMLLSTLIFTAPIALIDNVMDLRISRHDQYNAWMYAIMGFVLFSLVMGVLTMRGDRR